MTPEDFKTRILQQYPEGITGEGIKYSDLDAVELTQRMVEKYPNAKTSDGIPYADFLKGSDNSKGYFDRLKESYMTSGKEIIGAVKEGAREIEKGLPEAPGGIMALSPTFVKGAAKAGLRTAGEVAGATFAPLGVGLEMIFEYVSNKFPEAKDSINKVVTSIADRISDIPEVQEFATRHPNAEKDFQRALNLIFASGERGLIEPSTVASRTARQGQLIGDLAIKTARSSAQYLDDIAKAITYKNPQQVEQALIQYFEKGVRPSVVGRGTEARIDLYRQNAINAVKTIADNKKNLNLVNEYNIPTGGLPTTLKEFSQSIQQTKKIVFDKYDAMAKKAGEKGAAVDLMSIADELDVIVADPVMNDIMPEIVKYAEARSTAFRTRGNYDATQAQQAIEKYNSSLEAFYKNPSYDNATKAAVDAMIVNKLRQNLDKSIESFEGTGYADLRKDYGSLRAIEKDVVNRAIVDARKNSVGLVDALGNIGSGIELVRAIVNLDPASLATSAAIKGIKDYVKFLNDPNTSIKKMFELVEKQQVKPKVNMQKGAFNPSAVVDDLTGKSKVAGVSDDLIAEAKKYKSAEEFVKANTVYRSGELKNGRKGLKGDWFSTTEDYAKAYSDRGELKDYVIKPNSKILSYEDIPSKMKPYPSGNLQWDDFKDIQELQNKAFEYAKKNGYDAVRWGGKELNIINRDIIQTKSQLTDIWNKANQLTPEQSLIQEAKKYKSIDDFIKSRTFRDGHQAPSFDTTPLKKRLEDGGDYSLKEVVKGYHNQPKDYFDPIVGPRYYSYGDKEGMESLTAINNVKRGAKEITAYRTVPKEITVEKLQDGDWISFSKSYAVNHGESRFGEGEYRIIEQKVSPDNVWWDGNDIREWGFDTGKTKTPSRYELTKIWNEANQ